METTNTSGRSTVGSLDFAFYPSTSAFLPCQVLNLTEPISACDCPDRVAGNPNLVGNDDHGRSWLKDQWDNDGASDKKASLS